MVGYDDKKFKDLANETKLPQQRQDTCAGDYSNVRGTEVRLARGAGVGAILTAR
jgi:hypothetical protein